MAKQILINSTPQETRIALIEHQKVIELFYERNSDKGIVGNVYKGKVVRVLPGMQAAFVDIGHERAAFLYAGDFYQSGLNTDEYEMDDEDEGHQNPNQNRGGRRGGGRRGRRTAEDVPPIAQLVREGQEILIQVAKGPIGTKGARVTCHLSLPGRFVVFMPTLRHNGVSRKIENYETRKRLKRLIDQYRIPDGGFIVRTAAGSEAVQDKYVKNDVEYLKSLWQKINRKFKQNPAPKLLHYDLDLTTRMIRDHLDEDIDFFVVDSAHEHRKVLKFIRTFNPDLKNKVELYLDNIPLFDRYNIENEINKALGKRVWLKSGGYLLIENTEALTSIDVNTGRFVGKKTLEETILKTNMEAAEEIIRQLRLRNIGGIIIIDFIDMERDSSKEQVYRYLERLVREDKQKTTILKISNLGLVEMTRKRSRMPLHRYLGHSCQNCDGRGFLKSGITIAHQALRDMRRELAFCEEDHLHVTVNPEVYTILTTEEQQAVIAMEKHFQKGIKLKSDDSFHLEQIGIHPQNAAKMKGAKIDPLPFSVKTPAVEDYAQDEEDQADDEEAYQKDVAEVQGFKQQQQRSSASLATKAAPAVASNWTESGGEEVTRKVELPSPNASETFDEDEDDFEESAVAEAPDDVEAPVIRNPAPQTAKVSHIDDEGFDDDEDGEDDFEDPLEDEEEDTSPDQNRLSS